MSATGPFVLAGVGWACLALGFLAGAYARQAFAESTAPSGDPELVRAMTAVWCALFLAFLSGVLLRPSIETVMASGAATLVLLKIAYDHLGISEPPMGEMFE